MDNTIHFWKYNGDLSSLHPWQESPFFLHQRAKRRKRFAQMAREKKRNLARRELQRTILLLLIDAKRNPVHNEEIAEHIGRSQHAAIRFLRTHDDHLWLCFQGDKSRWWTSLPRLPDRLFY